jgi:hypothetical protein
MADDEEEHEKTSFWSALGGALKSPPVAVILVGAALALFSAFPSIPYLGPFAGDGWRRFIAVSGAVIIATGLGKLLGMPRNAKNAYPVKRYGLRIDLPSPGSPVSRKIRIEGLCKKLPPQGSLIMVEKSPATSRYWLKAQTPEFNRNRWWFSDVYVGGSKGDERVLYLALMGESGKAFRDYYLLVREKFNEPLGIVNLPADILLGPQVSVRQTEYLPATPNNALESYGMRILWPPANAVVGSRIRLSGTYETKPPQDNLVIYEKNEDDNEYWFKQEKPEFNEINKQWSAVIYIGSGKGQRVLSLGTTGEGGKAARNYCKVVYDRIERWIPLESLPPDIRPFAEVRVSYSADERLHTRSQ